MYHSVAVILLLFRFTQSQDANCDYTTNVAVGRTYYIYSPNYPNSYSPGIQCRWIGICPSGYNCTVECNINIPKKKPCSTDRLLISKTGDPQLESAESYCGQRAINVVSTGQVISIGLVTSKDSKGGEVFCTLAAVRAGSISPHNSRNRRVKRIVGGQDTKVNEYTMMAAIVENQGISCGAVIISHTYVVTAAECVNKKSIDNLAVVVGEHDISNRSETPATKVFRIKSYVVHPQYNPSNYDYDIAVIRVNGTIAFSDRVAPVCLPLTFLNSDFNGARVTLLGWGSLFSGGPTSDVLQKVDVIVISQSTCQNSVPDVTKRQLCTYSAGKDACQRDEGGPVLYTDPRTGRSVLVGIISTRRSCASRLPGVNTRITSVLNWIVRNAPGVYCLQ